jgi:hypothetical protein
VNYAEESYFRLRGIQIAYWSQILKFIVKNTLNTGSIRPGLNEKFFSKGFFALEFAPGRALARPGDPKKSPRGDQGRGFYQLWRSASAIMILENLRNRLVRLESFPPGWRNFFRQK